MFREVPTAATLPTWLWLKFSSLLVLARILWQLGVAESAESPKAAKARAKEATAVLTNAATTTCSAVLLGHGYFNRLIARELTQNGWTTGSSSGYGYGSVKEFCKR